MNCADRHATDCLVAVSKLRPLLPGPGQLCARPLPSSAQTLVIASASDKPVGTRFPACG